MDMTRRGFLAGGAALGGLMASSALPVLADDPSLFPGRGRFERLSLNYHEIKAGASKPFTVLHISDTHLTAAYPDEGEWERKIAERRIRTFGGRQEEALRDSIAWAKLHTDYIVHTGDLIDFQSRANFDLVKKYYGEGGAAMLGCLGNHEHYRGKAGRAGKDGSSPSAATVPDMLKDAYPFPNDFSAAVLNGVNFVMIDDSANTVSAEQASRFEAEAKKGLPIILCMHCPFPTREIVLAASRFWRSKGNLKAIRDMDGYVEKYKDKTTADFVAYLRAQPLLKGILCGHGHIGVVSPFSPTAKQYEVAGNFMFHAQEFTVS